MRKDVKPRWHKARRQWYARIGDLNEKGHRKQVYFPLTVRSEADAWLYFTAINTARAERVINTSDPSVADLSALYARWLKQEAKAGRCSVEYVGNAISALKPFVAFEPTRGRVLGRTLARRVEVDDLLALCRWMVEQGYKFTYVRSCAQHVQALFAWGARPIADRDPRRILPSNPLAGARLEIPKQGQAPKYLDAVHARRFLRYAWGSGRMVKMTSDGTPRVWSPANARFNRLFAWMLRFLWETGCRPKEAASIEWTDIDWQAGVITLDAKRHKTGRKTGKVRTIFFSGRTARILRTIYALPGRHERFVFTHRATSGDLTPDERLAGEPWKDATSLGEKLGVLRDRAIADGLEGLEGLHLYRLRHTRCTNLLLEGVSPVDAAKMVGNSPHMLTTVYDHVVVDQLAARAREADERIRKIGRRPRS